MSVGITDIGNKVVAEALRRITVLEEQFLPFSGCTITKEKSRGQTFPVLEPVD